MARANLDIAVLRTFVVVAERASMTSAAKALHLTQGAVSQQMARLEAQLGRVLFLRSGRKITLSAEGRRLQAHALRLLDHHDEVCGEFLSQPLTGAVRLGIPFDIASAHAPALLAGHARDNPSIELSMLCGTSSELLARLDDGELDLVIAEGPANSTGGECLSVTRLIWVGANGGIAHTRKTLPVSLVSETCAFRPVAVDALTRHGRVWRTVFENGGLEATMASVRADLAVTAWLESMIPPGVAEVETSAGLPPLPPFSINLHRRTAARDAAVDALANLVRQEFRRP